MKIRLSSIILAIYNLLETFLKIIEIGILVANVTEALEVKPSCGNASPQEQ